MYLENVFLHGGPAPALPNILRMSALKESESTVDNGSKFLTTYLSIIAFSSVCATSFCEAVRGAHVSHTWPAIIINNRVLASVSFVKGVLRVAYNGHGGRALMQLFDPTSVAIGDGL